MGREVKRVPLNFDWPLNKVWQGYLTPERLHGESCPHCHGGETWASRWLYMLCYRVSMLASDVRDQEAGRPMHPWLAQDPHPPIVWHPRAEGEARPFVSDAYDVMRPGADIVDLLAALAKVEPAQVGGIFGGNVEYDLYKAILDASGLENWGACKQCEGHGETELYPGQRAEREAWEPEEPPTGEGWQLWETVSEGSPISPVFPDAEGLAQWLTTPAACWGAMSTPMTIEQARGFVGAGWAPSGFVNAGGVHDGATFVGTEAALGERD
jgi:hypothetical protein